MRTSHFAFLLLLGCPSSPKSPTLEAPSLVSTTPSNGATAVGLFAPVSAQFSQALDPSSLGATPLVIVNAPAGAFTYDSTTNTVTFTPTEAWRPSLTYSVSLGDSLTGLSGAKVAASSWQFTTGPAPLPVIAVTSHSDGANVAGTRSVTVSGTIQDILPITSVAVVLNGTAVSATSDQTTFSAPVTLANGTNTIAVTVTNKAGGMATLTTHLVFPYMSVSNFQAASVVIGHADFTTQYASAVNASSFNAHGLGSTHDPLIIGGKLYLVDTGNHRVLGYNTIPSSNGAAADFVLGQVGFTGTTSGTGPAKFSYPYGMSSDGTKFFVAEYSNNRVLVWNTPPVTNTPADSVIGWPNLSAPTGGCSPSTLHNPVRPFVVGNKFLLVDYGNNRVLVWNSVTSNSSVAPDMVLGQADFTHCETNDDNQDGAGDATPSARTLAGPWDVWSDGTRLAVTELANNRVLVWSTFPTASFTPADIVLGQENMQAAIAGTGDKGLNSPRSVSSNGNQLFVSDRGNYRVVFWNTFPTASHAAFSGVLGQQDFFHYAGNDDNQDGVAGTPSARTFGGPEGLTVHGNQLFVGDSNDRYLIFNGQ